MPLCVALSMKGMHPRLKMLPSPHMSMGELEMSMGVEM